MTKDRTARQVPAKEKRDDRATSNQSDVLLMDEEWAEAVTANPLLAYLRPWKRHRREFQLYICASYRQSWRLLNEPCRELVEKCEQAAYGMASAKEIASAKRAVSRKAKKEWLESGSNGLAEVGPGLLQMLRLEHLPGWEGMPPRQTWFTGTEEQRIQSEKDWAVSGKRQVNLLRDVFCNPFRPVFLDHSAVSSAISRLAQAAHDDRQLPEGILSPSRLAELADELEKIGCANDYLLAHLTSPGPHVRGCWALDLIRGYHRSESM